MYLELCLQYSCDAVVEMVSETQHQFKDVYHSSLLVKSGVYEGTLTPVRAFAIKHYLPTLVQGFHS